MHAKFSGFVVLKIAFGLGNRPPALFTVTWLVFFFANGMSVSKPQHEYCESVQCHVWLQTYARTPKRGGNAGLNAWFVLL